MTSAPGLPSTPKEDFLASVRNALGRADATQRIPVPSYPPLERDRADLAAASAEVLERLNENRSARLDQLAESAAQGGWNVHRVGDAEDAVGYIDSLLGSLNVANAVRSNQAVFDRVPLDSSIENNGRSLTVVSQGPSNSRESLRQKIVEADIGITGVDYAIAETGSVILVPRKGLSRLVSLVPPVHVALVQPEEVIDTLDDLFLLRRLNFLENSGDMGSYLNFITGPSRTADIEQTLVVGVHGPKEVHLILLGQ
jgi:L-lactate dehydrogenase complex protein LldG